MTEPKVSQVRPSTKGIPPIDEHSMLSKILHHDAFSAVLLLGCAAVAFIAANASFAVAGKPLGEWYEELWHLHLGLSLGEWALDKPLHLWINDGLMAIFFFVVGLEIKRELLIGELSSVRKAMLPIAAAIGGMAAPALVFTLFNYGGETSRGWGIPMATDIAFSAGVLGLLKSRVPASLAVFLIALAIVDDLGAVIVIALFYTERLAVEPLLLGIGLVLGSLLLSRLGMRSAFLYMVLFIVIWFTFLESGVHATIAGVLFAFTIPVDARYDTPLFIGRLNMLLQRFHHAEDYVNPRLVNARQQRIIRAIETECIHVEAPLQRIENKLHPYAALLIMPIFAIANSGVHIEFGNVSSLLMQPVTLGVFCGLLFGKQIGIMLGSFLAVRLGIAELPEDVRWIQVYGLSWLAGIGFTMSLFVAGLAFGGGHGAAEAAAHGTGLAHLAEAKVGILCASIVAGIGGVVILTMSSKRNLQVEG